LPLSIVAPTGFRNAWFESSEPDAIVVTISFKSTGGEMMMSFAISPTTSAENLSALEWQSTLNRRN